MLEQVSNKRNQEASEQATSYKRQAVAASDKNKNDMVSEQADNVEMSNEGDHSVLRQAQITTT